jgi:hypothetical protein
VPEKIVETTVAQFRSGPVHGNKSAAEHHFAALKRMLDRKEPDYAN